MRTSHDQHPTLDFARAWHGERTDCRSLLADRQSVTHALIAADYAHGLHGAEALGSETMPKTTRDQQRFAAKMAHRGEVFSAIARREKKRYRYVHDRPGHTEETKAKIRARLYERLGKPVPDGPPKPKPEPGRPCGRPRKPVDQTTVGAQADALRKGRSTQRAARRAERAAKQQREAA